MRRLRTGQNTCLLNLLRYQLLPLTAAAVLSAQEPVERRQSPLMLLLCPAGLCPVHLRLLLLRLLLAHVWRSQPVAVWLLDLEKLAG
jgi:hypothetical protein